MLLARGGRCDAIDATVVCLASDGDDILASGPGGVRALAEAVGIHAGLIPSGPPDSPIRTLSARAGLQLSGLSDGGCPGVAGWPELRTLAALTSSGSQVGSQRGATPGDARPRPATEAPGERHTGPRPATCGDGRSVHGMQEVRSSSLRSSTRSRAYFECSAADWTCPSGASEGQFRG